MQPKVSSVKIHRCIGYDYFPTQIAPVVVPQHECGEVIGIYKRGFIFPARSTLCFIKIKILFLMRKILLSAIYGIF